jgi:hypothetical protein
MTWSYIGNNIQYGSDYPKENGMLNTEYGVCRYVENSQNDHDFANTGDIVLNYFSEIGNPHFHQSWVFVLVDPHHHFGEMIPVQKKEKHENGNKDQS